VNDDLDFASTLAAKSDQLNADDLAGGPITVQITGARVASRDDQPVSLRLSGGHMPWKPCKGMRRLLAEAAGSSSAKPWVGKWVRLFRDPRVKWGGQETGGIRVSGIDARILPSSRTFRVRSGRNAHTKYPVESLRAPQQEGAPTADLDALLDQVGLSRSDVDRWLQSVGKPSLDHGDDESRAKLAGWLGADPRRIEKVRELVPVEEQPPEGLGGYPE